MEILPGMVVRSEVYSLYWYFASERHQMYERKMSSEAGCLTQDPILSTFKFCNVFRASDRVSQYLIKEVAYGDQNVDLEDLIFRIVAFRTFSRISTWEYVTEFLGRQPLIDDLRTGAFEKALNYARDCSGGLYTGAFILCATRAYGFSEKFRNHVALFYDMFVENNIAVRILNASSLAEVFILLRAFPLMGDFMSYQIAVDLNYSPVVNFDENDFTVAGPGCLRGIRKVFESTGRHQPEEIIQWMVRNQDEEFDRLGLPPARLFGRPLHAIDCQGLFCEVDKYCREAVPSLTSARTRIKARYTPNPAPLQVPFFPPKWRLDNPSH